MSVTLESIAPEVRDDIFGDPINPESFVDFAGRVAYLPVCNYIDLKNSILYSHEPGRYEEEDRVAYPERGEAYAWRRVPRFFDRFKEVRDGMRHTYPNELILSLDIGSSIPLYPEMMRAHWLRKCGNFAADSLRGALSGYSDKSDSGARIIENNMRKDSEFKAAFVSCLQIALYCIPYELSGDSTAISDYLTKTMRFLLANSKRHIDRRDNKDPKNLRRLYESLGIRYDPSTIGRVPMERAWRIDACLGPTGDLAPLEVIQETQYRDSLSPLTGKKVELLHKNARSADQEGDHIRARALRREARGIIEARDVKKVGADETIIFVDELLSLAVDWAVSHGYACPVRFLSLDMVDPKELLAGMESGLDMETKLSGFGRRTRERLSTGDPDHIWDDISNIEDRISKETLALITSIESYPFYAEQPQWVRELGVSSDEIAGTMIRIMNTLKRKGEYVTFPWGKMPDYGGRSRAAQIAIDMLPESIIQRIARHNSLGVYAVEQQFHSPEEVATWFSQGEYDNLHGVSPAVDLDDEALVSVLRVRRNRDSTPSGALLGIKSRG